MGICQGNCRLSVIKTRLSFREKWLFTWKKLHFGPFFLNPGINLEKSFFCLLLCK